MFASILRSSFFSGLASVSSYFLLIALARAGSPVVFASFSYAVVCGLVIVLIVDCAADQCASQFILNSGITDIEAFRAIYALKVIIAIAVCLAIALVNLVSAEVQVPYVALLFALPAFYLGPIFEIRGQNTQFAMLLAAEKLALFTCCAAYVHFLKFDSGIYAIHFLVSVASLAIQIRLVGMRMPSSVGLQSERIAVYAARYWPVYLSMFAQATYGHASRLIVEARRGLLVFASVSLALQTLNALSIAQSQMDRHFRPAINRTAANFDAIGLKALFNRYLCWYVAPLCLTALIIAVYADQIVVALFGVNWAPAAGPMRNLSFLIVTVPLLRFLEMVVVAVQAQRLSLVINLLIAGTLLLALVTISSQRPIAHWLFLIVGMQCLHVAVLAACIVQIFKSSKFAQNP